MIAIALEPDTDSRLRFIDNQTETRINLKSSHMKCNLHIGQRHPSLKFVDAYHRVKVTRMLTASLSSPLTHQYTCALTMLFSDGHSRQRILPAQAAVNKASLHCGHSVARMSSSKTNTD
jgi:hypothetical protein